MPGILLVCALFVSVSLSAQVDTVNYISGDFLIGEVQKLEKNILTVETIYSGSDFDFSHDTGDKQN